MFIRDCNGSDDLMRWGHPESVLCSCIMHTYKMCNLFGAKIDSTTRTNIPTFRYSETISKKYTKYLHSYKGLNISCLTVRIGIFNYFGNRLCLPSFICRPNKSENNHLPKPDVLSGMA